MCSEGYEPCKKCSHTHCLIKQGIIMFTGNSFNFTGKFPPIVCIFPAPLYASNEAIFHPNVMRPLKHQISNKIKSHKHGQYNCRVIVDFSQCL